MTKPFLLFRGPVETVSGYGAHSRDLLWALKEMDLFEIRIHSCAWGTNQNLIQILKVFKL